jgi:RNA polymerase sigma factor FliA
MRAAVAGERLEDLWDLWRKKRQTEARDKLICHYLPLVEFLARGMGRFVDPSFHGDVYGFGVIGLMDAVDRFRPDVGARFETYASLRIRGAMVDGLRSLQWLPRGARRRQSRVIDKVVPIDFQTACTPVGKLLTDTLADPLEAPPLADLELEADHEEVNEAVGTLPERERRIVTEYYFERRALAEIGADMGITSSRVCQLHRRALRMLEVVLVACLSA